MTPTALQLLFMTTVVVTVLAVVLLHNGILLVYAERKILADMQVRMGPMRVGRHGILQTVADAIKLVLKEDTIPGNADRWLFTMAPIIFFVPAFLLYLALPVTEDLVILNMDIGIYYIFAFETVVPVGIIVAGWASYNKYSLLGGLRAAAQQLSYEVPLLLSGLGVIMLASSLSLVEIVRSQDGLLFGLLPNWFIFYQPFGFLFYLIAGVADLNRTPFDIPEAESELVAGYAVEYSGMKFAIFQAAEYSNVFVVSAVAALLFLGGWQGPWLHPIFWFAIKTYAIIFIIIWLRGTLPRVRIDQLMALSWKILLPATLFNILLTGVLMI